MTPATQACAGFVQDINAYVDDELDADGVDRLTGHARDCPGCNDYIDTLRRLSGLHRRHVAESEGAALANVDVAGVLASVTRTLVEDKRETLARLFYELGKSYVLEANTTLGERRQSVVTLTAPKPIRSAHASARRTLREAEDLEAAQPGRSRGATSLFRRSRRLFDTSRSADVGALTKGRRFLEEALAIEPGLEAARLYLGFQFFVSGRLDRARIQFRKVYLESRDPVRRLMAMQGLGKVHMKSGDYRRAVECYAEVVSSEHSRGEPRLLMSYVDLAVSCAHAGWVGESVDHFSDLVRRFPSRLPQIRGLLSGYRDFRSVLEKDPPFRQSLRQRVPALFAA